MLKVKPIQPHEINTLNNKIREGCEKLGYHGLVANHNRENCTTSRLLPARLPVRCQAEHADHLRSGRVGCRCAHLRQLSGAEDPCRRRAGSAPSRRRSSMRSTGRATRSRVDGAGGRALRRCHQLAADSAQQRHRQQQRAGRTQPAPASRASCSPASTTRTSTATAASRRATTSTSSSTSRRTRTAATSSCRCTASRS